MNYYVFMKFYFRILYIVWYFYAQVSSAGDISCVSQLHTLVASIHLLALLALPDFAAEVENYMTDIVVADPAVLLLLVAAGISMMIVVAAAGMSMRFAAAAMSMLVVAAVDMQRNCYSFLFGKGCCGLQGQHVAWVDDCGFGHPGITGLPQVTVQSMGTQQFIGT